MVFSSQLGKVEEKEPQDAIHNIANHIRKIQEELEYRLSCLDSSNINEIDAGITSIYTEEGNLQSVLSDAAGNLSMLEQTAASLSSQIIDANGNISALQQTAAGLQSTVLSQGTAISTLQQTSSSISASVADLESGQATMLRMTSDGVVVENESGARVTISGGQINATDLNLTGRIQFTDLDSTTQTDITNIGVQASNAAANASNALSGASSALEGLMLMGNGQYQGGTFINGKNIYAPNLYGDTINLLDSYSRLVGTMSLQYQSTFAYDLTSYLGLRMQAALGQNAYFGTSGGPYLLLTSDGVQRCQLGGGALVIPADSSGSALPAFATTGQVYFLLG